MYAIFTAEGEIQEISTRGFLFACIFRSREEAEKVKSVLINPETFEIRPIKVY